MKIVASDYKGKYFNLIDEDRLDDAFDCVIEYVDVDFIINNEKALHEHVDRCIYYGIPAYIGGNEELKAKIQVIEDLILTDTHHES